MRAFVLALLMVGGCVSADYMAVGDKTYPPRPKDYPIDVYVDDTTAPVTVVKSMGTLAKSYKDLPPHDLIGRVDLSGAPAASWSSMVDVAKAKARVLGGDGVVFQGSGSYLSGVDSYGTAYHGKQMACAVVRYHTSSP